MNAFKNTNTKFSILFNKFRNIPDERHNEFISFCNFHFKEIQNLEFEEYIEIRLAYITAIFNLDRSYLFYKNANQALHEILNQPEFSNQYKHIYIKILILKAKRLVEEKKILAGKEIYKSILILNPMNQIVENKLINIILRQKLIAKVMYFGITIILLILTLIMSISEHFFIIPFFPHLEMVFQRGIIILFISSIVLFSITCSGAFYQAKRELKQFKRDNKV